MEKINLNFFGEEVTINTPEDISSLKEQIAEKYSFTKSDVAEIILYYVKDSKKIYIINGNDFSIFKESKIPTIFLDVNQNSKLYLDSISKIKTEEKIDVEKAKKEIEKLKSEKAEIDRKMKEKIQLYNDRISSLIKQIVEMEKLKDELSLECDLDADEFREQKKEIDKKIEEIQKKIEPKKEEKEEIVLKAPPKPVVNKGTANYAGQNNFPYSKEALKASFESRKKYMEKFNAAKEKRIKERKALEEQKKYEAKNEELRKNMKISMPNVIPIIEKVNAVLEKTVCRVKLIASEKVMTKEERIKASDERIIQREKDKAKKEQIDKIIRIAKDTVNEINGLTKLVIEQSNSLIEKINNPQLYNSTSSDDILLRAAPKVEKKEKPEIHFNIICDGCKVTPLRGKRYKCKQCRDFDFCEECYKKNKESHGHDFHVIERPHCRNRLGHKNTKYCQRGLVHSKVMCDGCGMLPLVGYRYKCALCDDYNLCENCVENVSHNHPFLKIDYSLLLEKFNENYLKLNTYESNK